MGNFNKNNVTSYSLDESYLIFRMTTTRDLACCRICKKSMHPQ